MNEIETFIKENFAPVEDKPGYVWFSKRNFQIISIETLTKSLKERWEKVKIRNNHMTVDELAELFKGEKKYDR